MKRQQIRKKISKERIAHMHGVAEYMYTHAKDYNLNPDEMYFLGLNHDIGYINGKEAHEEFAASFLSDIGVVDTLINVIKWHGATPQEYASIHFCADVDIPTELVLLWEADMRVDMSGEDVGYDNRLEGIKVKYGAGSEPYRICKDTINWLRDWKDIINE